MIKLLLIAFILVFQSCGLGSEKEVFVFKIKDPLKVQEISIKVKNKSPYQEMEVILNTLNDTCMIGVLKIPPGLTGTLYKTEFFADSLSYFYFPYKATEGKLTIKHIFY